MDLRERLQLSLGSAYTLERELGGGGMSRVFIAEERALGRKIVVKVLPADTGAGLSAERFRREIQVAARLQHPHIVPLLSAGETDGLPFYTMPFVQGESLRARLSRSGELSVNEAVHALHDVAAALAYAHGEGVVHRDIKPDNVILSGGVAVVTDFGVAKAMDLAATEAGGGATGLTSLGVALGTPAYMSPEQATADSHVDHRADIYSFGCLAYELLAGSSPFAGRSPHQMLAAHVTETPEPLAKRRPSTPPVLDALVTKCLEKRPGDRPQSAEELLAALDAIATPTGGTSPTGARLGAHRPARVGLLVAAAGMVVVTASAFALWWQGAAPKAYLVGATTPIAVGPSIELEPAISPDGRFVAYTAPTAQGRRIFVRQIDGGRPVAVAADLDGSHLSPRWSPDGSRLMFVANGAAYVVPALGGAERRAFDVPGGRVVDPAWSPDGTQIGYGDGAAVWVRPAVGGGEPRRIAEGTLPHSLAWSPDQRYLAWVEGNPMTVENRSTSVIMVGSVERGKPVRVSDAVHVNASPVWTPDGRALLFVSSMGGPLDVYQQGMRGSRSVGAPVRLTTGLSAFSVSLARDGSRLAYSQVRTQSNVVVARSVSGRTVSLSSATPVTTDNQIVETMSVSRDGQWLAYDSNRGGNFDIYKIRLDGGEPIQITTNPSNDFLPHWSPDRQEIAFHSTRTGTRDIFVVSAEGGTERAVTAFATQEWRPRWSPDGQRILYTTTDSSDVVQGGRGGGTLSVVTRNSGGSWSAPRNLGHYRDLSLLQASWSPDGKLIAFASQGDVWVLPADGGAARRVIDAATLGGAARIALWASDAGVLYVHLRTPTGASAMSAVPLSGGAPRRLIEGEPGEAAYRWEFDTDGGRFFFTRAKVESDVWVMELKR